MLYTQLFCPRNFELERMSESEVLKLAFWYSYMVSYCREHLHISKFLADIFRLYDTNVIKNYSSKNKWTIFISYETDELLTIWW